MPPEMEDRPEQMSPGGQLLRARELVHEHYYYSGGVALDDIYVVWFCKVLQNWKALVSTNVKDDMYYEVTHNGDKKETYIDAYQKFENVIVLDPS